MKSITEKAIKKLAIHPWTKKVNPNFYEDCTLTPRGKRVIDEKAREILQSFRLQRA